MLTLRRLESQQVRYEFFDDVFPLGLEFSEYADMTSGENDILDGIIRDETNSEVREVLSELSARDRDILISLYFCGMKKEALAAEYGVWKSTISRWASRAERKFLGLWNWRKTVSKAQTE